MTSNESNPGPLDFKKHRRRFWKIPFIVIGLLLIKGALILGLWNALVPELFHGPVLTYWQALGLMVLAKLLIGHHGLHPGKGRFGPFGKWHNMSPEERFKLREAWHNRFSPSTQDS